MKEIPRGKFLERPNPVSERYCATTESVDQITFQVSRGSDRPVSGLSQETGESSCRYKLFMLHYASDS